MDVRRAAVEEPREPVGQRDEREKAEGCPHFLPAGERTGPEEIVNDPSDNHQGEAADDGVFWRDRRVLHQSAGVIDHAEQEQPGEPGEERLEAEPVDLRRIDARALLLLHQIEPAAVHHPDAGRVEAQLPVEPGEVPGRSDPEDPGEDVKPAQEQIEPLAQRRVHHATVGPNPPRAASQSRTAWPVPSGQGRSLSGGTALTPAISSPTTISPCART